MSWLTDRLATLLPARGLSIDELARQLAIERSRLHAILAGAALPNDNLARRLAKICGDDPEEWLAHLHKEAPAPPPLQVQTGFVKVAAASEIPDGEMKIVCGGLVVIAHAAGGFHAFGNICPHAEGPLGEGFLDGLVVECPWHNGQWDITTGKGLTAFATADIALFELRVVGDDIEVKLSGTGVA
ncbi:MAG TPA: Rieske 2Fe-2S domain-containing protein [Stellaceae bacterium]|nr:Rieske 2Fe-2S domain-containing protein [Stellaceae bacterium]